MNAAINTIAVELRSIAGPARNVEVALTTTEAEAVRQWLPIARYLTKRRGPCWYRLVYPGFNFGVFSHGEPPTGRDRYTVRVEPLETLPEKVERTIARRDKRRLPGWIVPISLRALDVEEPDHVFSFDPDVAPPGYPASHEENQRRWGKLRPSWSQRRSDAGVAFAETKRKNADRHFQHRFAHAARRRERGPCQP